MDDNNLNHFILNNSISNKSLNIFDNPNNLIDKWLSDFAKSKSIIPPEILIHSFRSYYKGTFTSDNILDENLLKSNLKLNGGQSRPTPLAFIVNTITQHEASNDIVGHWVALSQEYCVNRNLLTLRYFDSFADPPTKYKYIYKYIEQIKNKCQKHNITFVLDSMRRGLQVYTSKMCGIYAAYFVIKIWESKNRKNLKQLFKQFGPDRKKNDLRMEKFFNVYYPTKYCHSADIYKGKKASLDQLDNNSYNTHNNNNNIKQLTPPPSFCPVKTLGLKSCFKNCKCHNSSMCKHK